MRKSSTGFIDRANGRDAHRGLYCRLNGRVFQLVKGGDKKFHMFRPKALAGPGALVGRYTSRGDATSALETIAYA
ncbi:hypothetical protein [Vitreimonas flagellata]|uniref:hypothetical protein n=1 Tax=Vitreimonas flagellata TaxID=2560861 RepID=UPI001075383D|nr:hypothetical protein [Vitreimonas flagellata]